MAFLFADRSEIGPCLSDLRTARRSVPALPIRGPLGDRSLPVRVFRHAPRGWASHPCLEPLAAVMQAGEDDRLGHDIHREDDPHAGEREDAGAG